MRSKAQAMTKERARTTLIWMILTAPNHRNLIPQARRKTRKVCLLSGLLKPVQSLWSKPALEVLENSLRTWRIRRVGTAWGWRPQVESLCNRRNVMLGLVVHRPHRQTKSWETDSWTRVWTQTWPTIPTQLHMTTKTRAWTADRIP